MKSTIISMLIVLCVLAIAPLLLFGDGGLLARYGLDIFSGSNAHSKAPKNLTNVTTDKKVQVYRWRDEHGVMQFSSTPPPETQEAEVVELAPNTNIVKAVEVPEEEPEEQRSGPNVMTVGSQLTSGGMKDLLDSTSLTEQMNEKQLEQQKLMEQILRNQK